MGLNADLPFLDKIKELFVFRGIPELYKLGRIEDSDFEDALIVLQASIYELEAYLESNWILDDPRIGELWQSIKNSLAPLVEDKSQHDQYLYQIKVYLKRELGLRSGSFPLNTSLQHFYYYKSCDVRLIRRLIYERSIANRVYLKPSNWHLYDLVTEIHDDVEDVFEDLEIYNCNRLLIEVCFNGLAPSRKLFMDYLIAVKKLNLQRKGSLMAQTDKAITATSDLLMQQVAALENIDFQRTRMFSKIM